jgi:hypothetical protein
MVRQGGGTAELDGVKKNAEWGGFGWRGQLQTRGRGLLNDPNGGRVFGWVVSCWNNKVRGCVWCGPVVRREVCTHLPSGAVFVGVGRGTWGK